MFVNNKYKKEFEVFWKTFVEMMKRDRLVLLMFVLSFFLIVVNFVLPILRLFPVVGSNAFIALHYNIYLGVDRFGSASHIFYIPVIGLLFFILNIIFQVQSYKEQKTLSLIFSIATPLFETTLLVAMVLIILVNL